jgi:hypothetical protein
MSAAVGVLTTAADDARSATPLGADEEAKVEIAAGSAGGPAEDGEEDDDSDAADPPECSARNPVTV